MRLSQEVPALSSQPSLAPFKGKAGGWFVTKLLCNKNTILLKTPKKYCSKSQSSLLLARAWEVSLIPGLILTPEIIKKSGPLVQEKHNNVTLSPCSWGSASGFSNVYGRHARSWISRQPRMKLFQSLFLSPRKNWKIIAEKKAGREMQ